MSTGFKTRVTGLQVSERFKGFVDTGYNIRPRKRKFYRGELSWNSRCKHYDNLYARFGLGRQAILTLAGQLTADGIFLEAAGDYPRAEEALKKCEDLNRKIKLPLLVRQTGYYMGKYGSCFWEKTFNPFFDARLIPSQENVEPEEQDERGNIIQWRQTSLSGRTGATWSENEIIHFPWDVTSQSWPYGTSMLIGLDEEFEALAGMETNAKDYTEKQAWPYELLQLGDGEYVPDEDELSGARSKWKNRQIGENIITTIPSDLKQGGTGGQPLQALDKIMTFMKENIIDSTMIPPISKQYSSTEASAKEMMPWARANIIQPMQQIIAFLLEDQLYPPYLEDLGYSVKLCPTVLWESPDAHKDEDAEYWAMLIQSGLPAEYAWEQLGFDMDKIKQLRNEQLRREAEQMQYQKVQQGVNPQQDVKPQINPEEGED